jgi:hypothetical protein
MEQMLLNTSQGLDHATHQHGTVRQNQSRHVLKSSNRGQSMTVVAQAMRLLSECGASLDVQAPLQEHIHVPHHPTSTPRLGHMAVY